jgi:hypothetical protein
MNKFDAVWRDGIWLGINGRTDEAIIGATEGVIKARSIKRKPDDEKFIFGELDKVKGLTLAPVPGKEGYGVPTKIDIELPDHGMRAKDIEEEVIVRRMRITRKNIEDFGMMEGCPGCKAVRLGRMAQTHSEECRNRIEKKLMETEAGKEKIEKDIERQNEMLARKVEAEERATKKRRRRDEMEKTDDEKAEDTMKVEVGKIDESARKRGPGEER